MHSQNVSFKWSQYIELVYTIAYSFFKELFIIFLEDYIILYETLSYVENDHISANGHFSLWYTIILYQIVS